MALKRGIVELAEYNSNWKKEYEKEEKNDNLIYKQFKENM